MFTFAVFIFARRAWCFGLRFMLGASPCMGGTSVYPEERRRHAPRGSPSGQEGAWERGGSSGECTLSRRHITYVIPPLHMTSQGDSTLCT